MGLFDDPKMVLARQADGGGVDRIREKQGLAPSKPELVKFDPGDALAKAASGLGLLTTDESGSTPNSTNSANTINPAPTLTPVSKSKAVAPDPADFLTNSGGVDIMGYADALVGRALEYEKEKGASPEDVEATRGVLTNQLQYLVDPADPNTTLAKLQGFFTSNVLGAKPANPYSELDGTGSYKSGSGSGSGQADPTSGIYSPAEIAAIQSTIGDFIKPYADSAASAGLNASNVLSEIANTNGGSPAYTGLIKGMAANAQSSGNTIALAYARQAQALPAIQAIQGQAQMANQIQSLQNQLAQYQAASQQSSNSGAGSTDLTSILAGLGVSQ